MYVVFTVVAAAVVFAVVAVTLGRGDLLDREPPHSGGPELGEQPVRPRDLADLRFSVVARGYRMDQVDQVIERLGDEITWRDARIAELEAGTRPAGPLIRHPRPARDDT
ncbi:DivIVA domain-containing protein [Phytoactinopolyspora alkaliphila]|uniref:DivIVA domain-containing protein n=1 Tax=Phytoactinopolyspora alkaliphila TaxID=1783498 RepID=A0A6N9YT32_9ACTN|nr:DivIVA domain-containing protein [Phytoactinopolyspora alkaliphila]NED98087.1 DivIVA domain-containing protein [Phytoactinopolyspora alkaliphila]